MSDWAPFMAAWSQRAPSRLDAKTANPGGWGEAYSAALAVLGDPAVPLTPAVVRALVIGSALDCAHLRGQTTPAPEGGLVAQTTTPPSTDREHQEAASVLGDSLGLLVALRAPEADKAPPVPASIRLSPSGVEAAGWPLGLIVVAVAAVAAYAIYEASTLAERWQHERERSAQLERAHVAAAELVRAHVDREQTAGTPLPLDPASKIALDALAAETAATAARQAPPRIVANVDGGAVGAGVGALVAIAAIAAFALSR